MGDSGCGRSGPLFFCLPLKRGALRFQFRRAASQSAQRRSFCRAWSQNFSNSVLPANSGCQFSGSWVIGFFVRATLRGINLLPSLSFLLTSILVVCCVSVCVCVRTRARTFCIRSLFFVLRLSLARLSEIKIATRTITAPGTPWATRISRMSSFMASPVHAHRCIGAGSVGARS